MDLEKIPPGAVYAGTLTFGVLMNWLVAPSSWLVTIVVCLVAGAMLNHAIRQR